MADLILAGRPCSRGVDVSRWQGTIDWRTVAANRSFAWIKASGGDGGLYEDGRWRANATGALAAGIPAGAYHFLGAHLSGTAQAHRFLDSIAGYGHDLRLPPVVDVEDPGTSRATVNDFLAVVEAELGRWFTGPTGQQVGVMIYTGASMAATVDPAWVHRDLWLAAYLSPTYPRPGPDVAELGTPDRYVRALRVWPDFSAWQWAGEDGRCPGVPGACDQNVGTREWLARVLGPARPPTTQEDPMADIDARLAAIEKQLGDLPTTLGAWEQDTRRLEGLQLLKIAGEDAQWLVDVVDGRVVKHHVTGDEKALLQLSGKIQTARVPARGADGSPILVDYLELADEAAAAALRALPEV